MVPRSGRVDGGVDHARVALALGEPRTAPVRSGWAGAPQRGRGNGGKVVRKRGREMKICRVKYYVDFRSILDSKRAYVPLPWNHLEHEGTVRVLVVLLYANIISYIYSQVTLCLTLGFNSQPAYVHTCTV